ncbi:MAG: hypothetical protein LBG72_07590, partial [Spirochaetaceae bacterium]|nr:hypothetical protein [Spirochaetaceae bacterium]
ADEPFITAGSGPVPGRLIIQTGDGKEHQITLAAEKVNEKRPAAVSSPAGAGAYVYALSDWLVNQLFKDWKQMESAQ